MSWFIVRIPSQSLVMKEPEVYPTTFDDADRAYKKAMELTRGRHNVSTRINDDLYVMSWYVIAQCLTAEEAAAQVKASERWTRLREENPTVPAEDE